MSKPISESQIQRAVIRWWGFAHRGLGVASESRLFSIPNGGKRSIITASIMKAEGARKGAVDFMLLVPRGGYHGLLLEMKRPGGQLTPEQKQFLKDHLDDGYGTAVCFTSEQAINVITFYLRLPAKPGA